MATIMIVDDAGMVRNILKVYLESAGHSIVAEAGNGKEACLLFEKHHPELVTMDITMPSMNGIDAIKKIRLINCNAKIVVISAMGQKTKIIEAIQCGAKHFIVKPFTAEKVIEVINTVLNAV